MHDHPIDTRLGTPTVNRLRRRPNRTTVRAAVATLAAAALAVTGFIAAPATTAAPNLEQVRQQVQTLQAKAETATERANEAQIRLSAIQSDLTALRTRIKREKKELNAVSRAVDNLARAQYASGGVDTSLQVLLADDPTQFLNQAAALDQIQRSQAAALRQTQTARLRLAQSEAELVAREKAAREVSSEMASAKQEADDRLDEAERVLNSLEAEQRRRYYAQLAAQRRASVKQAQSAVKYTANIPYSSARAKRAVSYALAQVGDRYVYGATGTSSWDCSGLTMGAYRQAGVSLPHYSYAQYQRSKKVPLSQAKPGDLVFYFGGGVHHVGMYIGNGKMVHAANPGSGVVVSDILGSWYRNYFTGIGRVI